MKKVKRKECKICKGSGFVLVPGRGVFQCKVCKAPLKEIINVFLMDKRIKIMTKFNKFYPYNLKQIHQAQKNIRNF